MKNLQGDTLKNEDDRLTPEELYILINIVMERNKIDIKGIKKLKIQKENYRMIQRQYAAKRRDNFNSTLNTYI